MLSVDFSERWGKVVLDSRLLGVLCGYARKAWIRMKRKDEYLVGHSDRGIVAAVSTREVAKAIAAKLWHEDPSGGAYITHRGKTWQFTGQWSAVIPAVRAHTSA